MLTRRSSIKSLIALGGLAATSLVGLRAAPSHATVRIINGFPAGGVVDVVSRRVGSALTETAGAVTVIVENRVGAGGRIACTATKNATPDGKTLLLTPDTVLALYPFIYKDLGYDPFIDFTAVATAVATTDAFAVGPKVPSSIVDIAGFLRWAEQYPESASFGSPGTGTPLHLLGSVLAKEAGIDLRHVAYRGAAPGITDLLGGHIGAMIAPTGNFLELYRAKSLRITRRPPLPWAAPRKRRRGLRSEFANPALPRRL